MNTSKLVYWVREFFGENAYPRYVAAWHARQGSASDASVEHHLLDKREYFRQRIQRLYGGDVHRCC